MEPTKESIKTEYSFKVVAWHSEKGLDKHYISLKISMPEDLRELLKSVTVPEEGEADLEFGVNDKKRYLVKRWVSNSVDSSYKFALFIKELLDSGETIIKFDEADRANNFALELKRALTEIVETITKVAYLDYKVVVTLIKP